MKNIAIYKLKHVEKALDRLKASVAQLEAASDQKVNSTTLASDAEKQSEASASEEIAALRKNYETLRIAASGVADRLDATLGRFNTDVSDSRD